MPAAPSSGWLPPATVPAQSTSWAASVPVPTVPRPAHRHPAQTLPFAALFPIREWINDPSWRTSRYAMFLLAAIAPFALLHLSERSDDIKHVAWGFSIYFAALWLAAIWALIKPEPQDLWLLIRVVAFTVVAGVAIAVGLEHHLAPSSSNNWLKMIGGVGVPEELAKALPVLLFVYRSKQQWSPRTFMFVGAVSGLTFGAAEAVVYSSLYAELAPYTSATSFAANETWRLLTDGLFHACMAGICAYFIGLASLWRGRAAALMALGLGISAVLHGLYDANSANFGGLLLAAVIVCLFTGYARSGDAIVSRLVRSGQIS